MPVTPGSVDARFRDESFVEVLGSHVGFVVGAFHLSQTHDLCHEWRLRSSTNELYCSSLSNARSGTHPDRSRRVRFDVDVEGSSHLLAHALCEDSSCRAIHNSVELCFSGTQCLHLIGCNTENTRDVLHGIPALRAWNSAPRFQPNLSLRQFSQCRRTLDDRI